MRKIHSVDSIFSKKLWSRRYAVRHIVADPESPKQNNERFYMFKKLSLKFAVHGLALIGWQLCPQAASAQSTCQTEFTTYRTEVPGVYVEIYRKPNGAWDFLSNATSNMECRKQAGERGYPCFYLDVSTVYNYGGGTDSSYNCYGGY